MAGRLPSSGSISIGQISAKEGYSPTGQRSMNDSLVRAFCGSRNNNYPISLGSARGNQVTVVGVIARSNYASSVTLPTVYLASYFTAGQTQVAYPLYTTVNVDVPPTWWANGSNNPRNMTSAIGYSNSRTGGGTGGKKNFYSTQTYAPNYITGGGYYSGKSTGNRNGQVTLQYMSLVKPNPAGRGS